MSKYLDIAGLGKLWACILDEMDEHAIPVENLDGVISQDNLPSYVDDVIEGYYYNAKFWSDSAHTTEIVGESGKIYVDLSTNVSYRWSGSAYTSIGKVLEYATQAEAEAGSNNDKVMTPLRTRQAIDANAYQLPLMSPDTRGGATLDEHGGLALRDGALGIGSITQESSGEVRGSLAGVTAKGHAEQVATTGKNLHVDSVHDDGQQETINGATYTFHPSEMQVDGTPTANTWKPFSTSAAMNPHFQTLPAGTYTAHIEGAPEGDGLYVCKLVDGTQSTIGGGYSTHELTFTLEEETQILVTCGCRSGLAHDNVTIRFQLELGSTATEYEPYSGGLPSPRPDWEQPIEVVRGRNLLDESACVAKKYIKKTDGTVQTSNGWSATDYIPVTAGETYTLSGVANSWSDAAGMAWYTNNKAFISADDSRTYQLKAPANAAYMRLSLKTEEPSGIQLERGTVTHGYVPYGDYVGLDVYDGNTHVSTTPIPLPSRGWVAGLPDGTADTLTIDGAGKVTWELWDAETTTAATDGVTGTVGVDVLSTTGQIADGATVLYELTIPVTEECGYVDMPDIPSDATVSIPELEALGVRYFIGGEAVELAKQWYQRARSEYEDRIKALEDAVAELATE